MMSTPASRARSNRRIDDPAALFRRSRHRGDLRIEVAPVHVNGKDRRPLRIDLKLFLQTLLHLRAVH